MHLWGNPLPYIPPVQSKLDTLSINAFETLREIYEKVGSMIRRVLLWLIYA